ncbi:hypothetical protein JCM5350_003944 [Sporobolomyces pararoseus]
MRLLNRSGYFLPTLPQTILLWSFVVFGLIYSGLTAAAFFRILEVAVGESYASGIVVDYGQTESGELEGEKIEKKLKILKSLSWSSVAILTSLMASSIGLFILGLKVESKEWLEFCTTQALLVSAPSSPLSSANSTTHSSEDPKLEMCALMELNQSYLIVGIPIIILTVEVLRHTKTLAFIEIASEFKIIERSPKLNLSHMTERDHRKDTHSTREGGVHSERELGRSRRSRRRYRVERDGSVSDESERERLLSV